MPEETFHLARAPIVEALIHFQANAAERWESGTVRGDLQSAWPEHADVQEMRQVQFQVMQEAGKAPESRVILPGIDGLVFRASGQSTVYHARRDGLIVSWLAPYANWSVFFQKALEGWENFRRILAPVELHAVALRYINRLEFPMKDFRLSTYFTAPPAKPPTLENWQFHGFMHQTHFAVPDSGCSVQVNFTPTDPTSETVSFILDIEVRLKESLAATGRDMTDALEEMRNLKNTTFFALLTKAAIERYK